MISSLLLFLVLVPIPLELGKINPLDFNDFVLQQVDQSYGPALSSALDDPNPWVSYNEWNCFPPESVELTYSEIYYDGWKKMPSLQARIEGRLLVFEPDADREVDVRLTLDQWNHLVSDSSLICTYAAFLQELDEKTDLFVLDRVKTERGSWVVTDEPSCRL